MSTVPPEELAERQAHVAKYHASRKIIQIDEAVRGIGIAIGILVKQQAALLAERDSLTGVDGLGK